MKKIWFSVATIVLTVGLVSSAAYALFSDTVKVQGISITTGSVELKIWNGSVYVDSYNSPKTWDKVYPGFEDYLDFTLKNNSDLKKSLKLSAKLVADQTASNWASLSKQVKVAFAKSDTTPAESDYKTLEDWTTTTNLNVPSLEWAGEQSYKMFIKILPDAGMNESLTGMTFDITGTME